MRASACDRCGETVPQNAPTRRTLHLTTRFSRRSLRQRLNLCGDCRQSFSDWFQQPLVPQLHVGAS